MKLVDTNVFMYAVGRNHDYRESCRTLIAQLRSGDLDVNIDVEVVQEILHIYHARNQTNVGIRVARDVMMMLPRPITVTPQTVSSATDLLERYPSIQSRDAVHAAVALEHGLEGIISADRGFDIIDGLKRFDPKELAA